MAFWSKPLFEWLLRSGSRNFTNQSTGKIVDKVEENKWMQTTAELLAMRGVDWTPFRLDLRFFLKIDLPGRVFTYRLRLLLVLAPARSAAMEAAERPILKLWHIKPHKKRFWRLYPIWNRRAQSCVASREEPETAKNEERGMHPKKP